MIRSGRPYFSVPNGVLGLLGQFEPGMIVDVGAAAGHFTKNARRYSPLSRSVSFEPFPGNWPFLERTLAGLDNAKIVKAAVADIPGESGFFVSSTVKPGTGWDGYDGYSSVGFLADESDTAKTIRVPVTTVDAHVSERVLFFKVDVQGGEMGVLRGAEQAFKRGIDICHIEFSGEREILDFLLDRDYLIFDHPYMAVGHDNPDFTNWQDIEPKTLSTGRKSYRMWPKHTPSDPADFAAMFADEAPRVGSLYTDIIAVRPEVAAKAGWA